MTFENLPDTWKVVRLGDNLIKLETGKRQKGGALKEGDVLSIGGEHINDFGRVEIKEPKYITFDFYKKLKNGKLQKGDIVVCKDGAKTGKVAYIHELPSEYCAVNEHVFIIRTQEEKLNSAYLFFFLFSKEGQRQIRERFHGIIWGIKKEDVYEISIPLPPLPEQKLIVEILTLAQDLIRKQKEAIALIDKILMAKFIEMFGDPATNPKGWEVRRLGDNLIKLETGKRQKGGALKEGDVLSIGGEHINDFGRVEIKEPKYITFDFYKKLKNGKLQKGDIVVCKDGAKTGKVAYIHELPSEYCAVNEHVFIIRTQEEKLNSAYLFFFLFSKEGQRQIRERFHGIIGGIKKEDVYEISIPLPPIELQKQFAQIVEEFEKKREEMQKNLETLESLFKLLQKKAFTGELTAKWREQNKIEWELPKITERQAVLLACLYYYQNLVQKPAMVTMAMKSAFLLQQEAGLNLGYNFIPYKYGPFSKEVYEDLEELEKNLLVERVKPKKDLEMTEIKLLDEFKDWTERIINNLPQKIKYEIKTYTEKYGKMNLNELLDYVYAKYPKYAIKSERKERKK